MSQNTLTPSPEFPATAAQMSQDQNSSANLSDEILMQKYVLLYGDDKAMRPESISASNQMKKLPFDDLDTRPVLLQKRQIVEKREAVSRRAPLGALSRIVDKKNNGPAGQGGGKRVDPALESNKLSGKLTVSLVVNGALFFVFLQALVFNFTSTGSFHASSGENSNIGPSALTLLNLGGLYANSIRKGQAIRIIWAAWMHSGWIHIGLNILCQLQYFYMLEPDWGVIRTFLTFFLSQIGGNLLSMNMDPCKVTVGSSGGLFGLMGAIITYCIEYWTSIPHPLCILVFSIITICLTFLTGLSKTTDTWAHLGGFVVGVSFGLMTITTPTLFRTTGPIKGPKKMTDVFKWYQKHIDTQCMCGKREWALRLFGLIVVVVLYAVCCTKFFSNYEFQPVGSPTWSGVTQCCCCYVGEAKFSNWVCNSCSVKHSGFGSFGEYCASTGFGRD